MAPQSQTLTSQTLQLAGRAVDGDGRAFEDLVNHIAARLLRLTRRMLRGYPHLQRWEQTDDVYQNAVLRLYKSLREGLPETAQHFWNLAALQIRRTLIDLARRHFGPEGEAAHHHSDGEVAVREQPSSSKEPLTLDDWCAFHEAVGRLPAAERVVFELLWYAGLTQVDAAAALSISLPTVQRRWYAAQVSLYKTLHTPADE